jgi:hypothetical protein
MLSTAFGEMPGVPGVSPPLPDHPLFVTYEYWMPQRIPPFGPLYSLCQNPSVPSEMIRMSPAHVPPVAGVNDPVGGRSVLHPLLFASGFPYPPIPAVEIVVFVVAGIAGDVAVAGIAGVAVTDTLEYPLYPARQPYSAP